MMTTQISRVVPTDPSRLSDLFFQAGDSVADLAARREVGVDLLPTDLMTRSDATKVLQVLVILLRCAIRHSVPKSRIRMEAAAADPCLRLMVVTDQPFVSHRQLLGIFERFCRDANGRERLYGGSGLHLALCMLIARMIGGELDVTSPSVLPGGFIFRLPC